MSSTPWGALPAASPPEARPVDPDAVALGRQLAAFIAVGAGRNARDRQVAIGSSEVGYLCDRRLAYRLRRTERVKDRSSDPWRALVGIAVHALLAGLFHDLDNGNGAFLVETPTTYRGIPGTADLVFRFGRVVVDWKTTKLEKIKRVRRDGVPRHYQVQAQLYGAALVEEGEDVTHAAVVYLPVDSTLDDMFVYRMPLDRRIADDAVERIERIAQLKPADAVARPDRLCAYCPNYNPQATDLNVSCPGGNAATEGS